MFSWSLLTQSNVASELVLSVTVLLVTTPHPVPSSPSPYQHRLLQALGIQGRTFLRTTLWL